MNKLNFDSFKHIRASEELIQSTLTAAEQSGKTPAVPWYRRASAIATAAGFLLAITIGITVYFFYRNLTPPISPADRPVPVTSASTESTVDTDHTEIAVPSDAASVSGQSGSLQASTEPTAQMSTVVTTVTIPVAPTRAAETSPNTPSQSVPTQPAATQPTQKPSASPTASVTPPQDPPTASPTFPELTEPEPIEPVTDPEIEPIPSEKPTDAVLTFRLTLTVGSQLYTRKIYCRIYDRDRDAVLGDPNLFTESHRADYTANGSLINVVYRPSEHGITVPPGNYTIAFQDENGNLLASYRQTIT